MLACKALVRASLLSTAAIPGKATRAQRGRASNTFPPSRSCAPLRCSGLHERGRSPYSSTLEAAMDCPDELSSEDTVEELLTKADRVRALMKMERRSVAECEGDTSRGWFPYLDAFQSGPAPLTSCEVVEAVGPYILESRKEKMRKVVAGRSYSICLVVEGLTDFGNVSAAFRSADAMGIQSVHVISKDKSKRCCRI